MKNFRLFRLTACLLISTAASLFGQGPLAPTAAPAPTMKSLDQVEARIVIDPRQPGFTYPYTITTPGSYYLAANLTPPAGQTGIVVNSNYVSIDFNGYSLTGVNSSGVVAIQVGSGNIQKNGFCLRNGMVNNWSPGSGAAAINAQNACGALFEKLIVTDNTGEGLSTGDGCTIKDCIARNQAGGTAGIGIQTGAGCSLVDCAASGNGGIGLFVGAGSGVVNCSAAGNGADGIRSSDSCSIIHCSAGGSGGSNVGFGIATGIHCTVSACTATYNQKSGISVSDGSTVTGSTAGNNYLNGIICSWYCHISNNVCAYNDSHGTSSNAGIIATNNGNTIDSNASDSNSNQGGGGYVLSGTNNILIRNSATGNGYNYNVGSGNTYGPIINMSSGGVISSASGTVNPWTNWIH